LALSRRHENQRPIVQHTTQKRTLTRLCVLSTIFELTFSVLGLATHTAHAAPPLHVQQLRACALLDQSFAGVSCPHWIKLLGTGTASRTLRPPPTEQSTLYLRNTAFNHPSECPTIARSYSTPVVEQGHGSPQTGEALHNPTSPNTISSLQSNYALGGDTHVAVAPAKESQWPVQRIRCQSRSSRRRLVGSVESTSQDGGKTWSNNNGGPVPHQPNLQSSRRRQTLRSQPMDPQRYAYQSRGRSHR